MSTVMQSGGPYAGDREALILFLHDARRVLLTLVEFRQLLMPQYVQSNLERAWPEVDGAFADAIHLLRGGSPRELKRPYPRSLPFDPENLDSQLAFFGLTGVQLQLKLASFRTTYEETMQQQPTLVQVVTDRTQGRIVRKKKGKLMEWLLEKINSILGSLARLIPSVDIIKEFKEMAEYGYKESQQQFLR